MEQRGHTTDESLLPDGESLANVGISWSPPCSSDPVEGNLTFYVTALERKGN